jgi:hypothetical protein
MKRHIRTAASISVLLLVAACTRPDAVRLTAQSAVPIASDLRAALPDLENRFEGQIRRLELDRTAKASLANSNLSILSREKKRMLLEPGTVSTDRKKDFNALTEDGAALLQDPFSFVGSTTVPTPTDSHVPTEDIDRMITGLSGMAKASSWKFDKMLKYFEAVQQERERIGKTVDNANGDSNGDTK